MNLGLVVEGDGDVAALPVLVRSLLHSQGNFDTQVLRPVRVGGLHNILNGELFPRQLTYVAGDPENLGVLITADCEDMCTVAARSAIIDRIRKDCELPRVPVGIVLFAREFESLFLSQADHLSSQTTFFDAGDDAEILIENAEQIRNAKGVVGNHISDFSYKETRDQARLTSYLDPGLLSARHRAGRKLIKAITDVLSGVSDVS